MALNKNISDEELVEKLRKGDIEAFDAVFEKYSNRLLGFALKKGTSTNPRTVCFRPWRPAH
jgi:hypothetical protein